MIADSDGLRHSKADTVQIITDPQERAEAEARNGLRQFDLMYRMIEDAIDPERQPFRLRVSMMMRLHREALDGLSSNAGRTRPSSVQIEGSSHSPPDAFLVLELLEDLCDYVNDNWQKATPVHLAAYVMWRLNWIHPFDDGNGRTSRAASYLVLCAKLGDQLPGTNTIPEQIVGCRDPYYRALDRADDAWTGQEVDVGELEELLSGMLSRQLVSTYQLATGSELKSELEEEKE